MIDLKRFSEKETVVAPIVGGYGYVGSRIVRHPDLRDGWYRLIVGDTINVSSTPATPFEIERAMEHRRKHRVYALGKEGIPTNWDNFTRLGYNPGEAVPVNFLDAPVFEVAKVVKWDDNRLYFYGYDSVFQRLLLREYQKAFDARSQVTTIKGGTPELNYYYLLLRLEREAFRQLDDILKMKLSEAEKKKRMEQLQNTFSGRLKHEIEQAGGKLVSFSRANANSYLVIWKLRDQTIKTTIRDNLQVLSAGYCLSGDDRRHTMASLVQLARMFRQDRPLYITRE